MRFCVGSLKITNMSFQVGRKKAATLFKKLFQPAEGEVPAYRKQDTLLLNSAKMGNISGITMALNAGARVDVQDPTSGKTALHYAAEKNLLPIIELLRDRGARGDIQDKETGSTPLMIATEKNHQKTIKTLMAFMENGLALQDASGRTVVNLALSIGKDKVANYFVDMGADAQGSAVWALENDAEPQLAWLMKHGATPEFVDAKGYSPLMRAVLEKNLESVKLWLGRGADPNWTEGGGDLIVNRGRTPLMVAIQQKCEEIAQAIIEHSATNPNIVDPIGETALIKAVRLLLFDTCQLLVDRGADHTIVSNEGIDVLISAAQSGDMGMVEAVWALGQLKPSQTTNNGWTPLMFAANEGNAAMVEFLLGIGADPNFRSTQMGITALDLARKSMGPKIAQFPHRKADFDSVIERLAAVTARPKNGQ